MDVGIITRNIQVIHNFYTDARIDKNIFVWNLVVYMTEKNFDEWNTVKKEINDYSNNPEPREGEVWFCSLGVNIGREQDGKHTHFERPVLVVRRWMADCFLGVPLSTKIKYGNYYASLEVQGHQRTALLIQMKLIDAHRLIRMLCIVSDSDLEKIRGALADLITKTNPPLLADSRRHNS